MRQHLQSQARPLLERVAELTTLDEAIAGAQSAEGRVLVIEGPPGIGKTSLLAEGRARAEVAGLSVLHARSSELEMSFSFGVVRQLFEQALARAEPDQLAELLDGAAVHAGRLFRPDADVVPPNEDSAFALLHGLYWLTLNLSEVRPLLIAIDDLQWTDTPSLRWLAHLVRRSDGLCVSVVATIRTPAEQSALLSELLVDPRTELLHPPTLSADAAAELVRAELGTGAEEAFCIACHRTTGGNPLLLRELLRALAAEDVSPVAESVTAVERAAPDAIARSVGLRLSRLPCEALRLARAVTILGDGADRDQAAALARLDHEGLALAAATLARFDLLRRSPPPLAFVHPLVRNVIYESIPADERQAEHARAAEIARAANARPAIAAAHVLLAAPRTVDGAVGLLREAAQQAASEGGLDAASRYLRRGLDEPIEDEERADLLLELGAIELSLGSPTVLDHLREVVNLVYAPERRAEARFQLGHALQGYGRDEEALREVKDALVEWNETGDLRRHLEAIFVSCATRLPGRFVEARRLLDSLELDAAEGPGARMLMFLWSTHEAARGGSRERAVAEVLRALRAAEGDERGWVYGGTAWSALQVSDELDESVHLIDAAVANARRAGAIFYLAELSWGRGALHFARGALAEAEADTQTALDALPHGATTRLWAHGLHAQILVERGATEEAAATLDAGEAEPLARLDALARAPLLRARAVVAAAHHHHEAALAAALALGQNYIDHGFVNPASSYPSWRSLAAQAQFALGRSDEALELMREDVRLARSWGAPRCLGRALRILGTLEGGEAGFEHLREAVRLLKSSPAQLEHAHALTDLGAALRRANRRREAREPLRKALELAHRCGATPLAERAHGELLATGARPRRRALSGVDALTPSERRIAAMAAEGLSNREIAQGLFLTPRTVEFHLSNAFRKLDISARTQLPEALAPSGLAA
jgi:DNA-binding CsgD family transcriptional regulator